jgi:maltose alpha-D-glucosyltransferase/alpha-amylase
MEGLLAKTVSASWEELFSRGCGAKLNQALVQYLKPRRWFGSKARHIRSVSIQEAFRIPIGSSAAFLTLLQVDFAEGAAEEYVVPFSFGPPDQPAPQPNAVVVRIDGPQPGILYDALAAPEFCSALLELIGRKVRLKGQGGEIRAEAMADFAARRGSGQLEPSIGTAEQSNSSVIFGDRLILKVFRRVQEGINPELEMGRFLTEYAHFPHTSPLVGAIEYQARHTAEPTTLAVLQGFVPNRGDAWKLTLDKMNEFAERVRGECQGKPEPLPKQELIDVADLPIPAIAHELIGPYLDAAQLLGQRTAELHLALASSDEPADFRPEPFSLKHQELLVQTLLEVVERNYAQFQKRLNDLPEVVRDMGHQVMAHAETIRRRLQPMSERPLGGSRCRCHGDYHLGQVLYTGADFVIIDFEGEPARPLKERRLKQSPLRDVAGMLRSFDYAAQAVELPEAWHRFWYTWVSAAFLKGYLATAAKGSFLPSSKNDQRLLLEYFLLEKAIYELAYEINHRPDWVRIPVQGIRRLLRIDG